LPESNAEFTIAGDGTRPAAQYIILTGLPAARSRLRLEVGPVSDAAKSVNGFALDILKTHYNQDQIRVHSYLDRHPARGVRFLKTSATFFEYILLEGRRITPLQRTLRKSAGSSIVKANIDSKRYCGLVLSFFRHDQPGIFDNTIWAELIWMEEQDLSPVEDDPWSE
jgi:hypothetical protein